MQSREAYLTMNLCGAFTCYPEPYPYTDGMIANKKTMNGPKESRYNVVYGILEAALGYANNGEYKEEIEELRRSIVIEEVEAELLPINVKKENKGEESKIRDFQTVRPYLRNSAIPQKYYDKINGYGYYDRFFSATNDKRTDVPPVKYKEYIVRAKRQVRIYSDPETIEKLKNALRFPYYEPYIGRANCIPSEPLLVEEDEE